MKIRTLVGVCGILCAAAASGRGETHWTSSPKQESPAAMPLMVAAADHSVAWTSWHGQEGAEWGQFRHGCLWEDYCLEKRACKSGCPSDCCDATACPSDNCAHVFRARPTYRGHAGMPCSARARERVAALDLFFDLLGWRKCGCGHADCTERYSCAALVPMEDSVPTEPFAPRAADSITQPPGTVKPDRQFPRVVPAAPRDAGTQSTDLPSLDKPEEPVDGDSVPSHEIPRNVLPKSKPAVPKSSRRAEHQALIAERLSDYIMTR